MYRERSKSGATRGAFAARGLAILAALMLTCALGTLARGQSCRPGQSCLTGGGFSPSFSGFSPSYQPYPSLVDTFGPAHFIPRGIDATVVVADDPRVPLAYHWVEYKGLNVKVKGYLSGPGRVSWKIEEQDPDFLASATPTRKPAPAVEPAQPTGQLPGPFFGVSPSHMSKADDKPRVIAETAEARAFVREAKGSTTVGGELPAPGKLHLTIIGKPEDRKAIMDDLSANPDLQSIRGLVEVQDYSPDDWAVKDKGYPVGGKPSIIVQTPGPSGSGIGRVCYRANDYSMGPVRLAEEIRRVNPDYHPERDPGPANGNRPDDSAPLLGITREQMPILIAVLAVGGVLLLLPSRDREVEGEVS